MKTAAIIAEYNPFHKGHEYHIRKTREITGADYVIAVMSGDFVQRGEPAFVDKYYRTGMALGGGADLVIELPVIYAAASAEFFATAGVKLLDMLSCVDYLSFGSEWAYISDYEPYVNLFTREDESYKSLLRNYLKDGCSFPLARSRAAARVLSGMNSHTVSGADTDRFLKEPNHILGIEYLKALKKLQSDIRPVVVKREGSAYHDLKLDGEYPSASAIRHALINTQGTLSGQADDSYISDLFFKRIKTALGENTEALLNTSFNKGFICWNDLMPLLDYEILMNYKDKSTEKRGEFFNRIRRLYSGGMRFDQLLNTLHVKNRTDSAIKRELLHILLQTNEPHEVYVPYARVLGFKKTAAPLMKKIRDHSRIPLIQKPAEGISLFNADSREASVYQTDIRAADLYEMVLARKCNRSPLIELKRQQIIID